MQTRRGPLRSALLVIVAYTSLFTWLFARPILEHAYLAESDLYRSFLPRFLSAFSVWSSYEFGGYLLAAQADDAPFYPLHVVFGSLVGSWTGYLVSAYVIGACGTYAYTHSITRSRLASTFAGLAYALSEAMMERIAHANILHAIAWLPLILLSVDRLRGPHPARWVAAGAFAAGCSFLIGHPQPALYACAAAALYALAGGVAERASSRYYLGVIAMFALAALLSAVKLLPQMDVIAQMSRQDISFAQFVSHSNTPAQMLSVLFPGVEHEGREAPTYVGLATLVLAILAVSQARANWRAGFWLLVASAAFLLGTGDATPLAALAFEVPVFDWFRVVARHLFLASFGAAVLAGLGIAALQRTAVSRRALVAAVMVVGLAMAVAAAAIVSGRFVEGGGNIHAQFALAAAAAAACIAFAVRPASRTLGTLLVVILAVDLVHALPYRLFPTGLEAVVVPRDVARPSVHITQLKAGLDPLHQRLLTPAGTSSTEVVSAGFGRLWGIPLLGGFGQLLPARHSALAMMGTDGSVEPAVLGDNPILDLLAVKYVVMKAGDFASTGTFERHGITWATEPLHVAVGEPECGQKHPRSASYALPAGVRVAALGIAMHLRCGEDVEQGRSIGTLRIVAPNAEPYTRDLRAGIEIAERALSDPALLKRARHTMATVFDPTAVPLTYYTRIDLPEPVADARLDIHLTLSGWLEIERLTAIDHLGEQFPQDFQRLIMLDARRWRPLTPFFTSRTTDRTRDEDVEGEQEYRPFENRRALARAWVTQQVIPLPYEEQLRAAHYSYLPNGERFDPARMAMVEPGVLQATTWPPGPASAQVTNFEDGAVSITVSTVDGGFLVLSEGWYPDWRARVDDRIVPIHRANVSLQGIVVPGGRHTVTFEFVSTAFRVGAAASALTLLVIAFVAWRGLRTSPYSTDEGRRSSRAQSNGTST